MSRATASLAAAGSSGDSSRWRHTRPGSIAGAAAEIVVAACAITAPIASVMCLRPLSPDQLLAAVHLWLTRPSHDILCPTVVVISPLHEPLAPVHEESQVGELSEEIR